MSDTVAALTEAELLAELGALAEEIQHVNDERDRLYARRRDLFIAGRRMDPPIGTKELGAAAGCSDVLVTNTVRKGAKA
jgi:hypothetical protein